MYMLIVMIIQPSFGSSPSDWHSTWGLARWNYAA